MAPDAATSREPAKIAGYLTIGAARLVVSLVLLASGFRAVSDDDYARVSIAARFAAQPALDPSGTSWLPLPFWIYGVTAAIFGDSLLVARSLAVLLGVVAALLVWRAARLLCADERTALLAALATVALPYGAWLSAAMVPEAFTAALMLFGAASLSRPDLRTRLLGGAAVGAACWSRYEAWATAIAFTGVMGAAAWRARRIRELAPVPLAIGPVVAWLLHGHFIHGDSLFFIARVKAYQAALGEIPLGPWQALTRAPLALVRFEPELCALLAVSLALVLVRTRRSPFAKDALGVGFVIAAPLALLVWGDLRSSTATHHAERALLSLWWFGAIVTAELVARLGRAPGRFLLPLLALPLAFTASVLLREPVRTSFVDRRDEERLGLLLRSAKAHEALIDVDDYGYFAVQAACGYGCAEPLAGHDPRAVEVPPPTTSAEWARIFDDRGADWLVTTSDRAPLAAEFGALRVSTPRLALFELGRSARPSGSMARQKSAPTISTGKDEPGTMKP